MPWLEQLLGEGQVQQPVDYATEDPMRNTGQSGGRVVRGIYCNMPLRVEPEELVPVAEMRGQHVDTQPAHLIVTAHIDALRPRSGGTLLWPGSHRLLHARNPAFSNLMQAVAFQEHEKKTWEGFPYRRCVWSTPELQRDFRAVQSWVGANLRPTEFCGGEGDVVLWHARCFHAASRNLSAQLYGTPQMRQAIFYDCHLADMLTDRAGDAVTHESQWFEWSGAVQAAAAEVEEGPELMAAVAAVRQAPAPEADAPASTMTQFAPTTPQPAKL